MISPQRFDTLKQITDPREFYNALLCDIPSLVKEHREVFVAKARDFDKKCLEYKAACDKAIDWKAVEEAVAVRMSNDGSVRCTTSFNPPKDGWKLIETQSEGPTPEGGSCSFPWRFWAPPDFPDNPADWFDIYKPFHYNPVNIFASKATCAPKDELLRDYVALAVLFNEGAEKRGETPVLPDILFGIEFPVECETLLEKQHWPKVKASLIRSLESVNKNLRELAGEQKKSTGTNITPQDNNSDFQGYLNKVAEEVCNMITSNQETRQRFIERIESYFKLYRETAKQRHVVLSRKTESAVGEIEPDDPGDAGQWLLPARLLSNEPMFWRRDRFREPTKKESLEVYYTLLAIIHDGQSQGNSPNMRIYFDWKDTDTDSLDVKQEIDKLLHDLPTQGNAPKPKSYFMGGKLCELPELANNTAYIVWTFYSGRPQAASWWGPLYCNSESKRRGMIQEALNIVRGDLESIKSTKMNAALDTITKQISWRDNDQGYMFLSKAIAKLANSKIALSTMSKVLTPDGSIHYMRQGRRCKVHIGDFMEYIHKEYPTIGFEGEVADEYIAGIEARKKAVQQSKRTHNQ